jgi:hypothetical protein
MLLVTGDNYLEPQAFMMHIRSDLNWEVHVKDAMDGNKPAGTQGRMTEYASSAYIDGEVLSQPLNLRSGVRDYVPLPLDGSSQFIEEGGPIPSPGTPFPISLYQHVEPSDKSLITGHTYRIVILFQAGNPP